MSKLIKLFIILLCSTMLFSCFKKENTNNNIDLSINNTKNENKKPNFDSKTNTLNIGEKVKIKNGIDKLFPTDIKIYKDNKTYVNSNVPNYVFFISDKTDKLSTIADFYKEHFKKLGYKDLSIIKKEDLESSQRLEFILENPKYKEFKPEDLNLPNPIISNEPKYLQRILININSTVPDNIKENMGLDGFFVEIYYNQI